MPTLSWSSAWMSVLLTILLTIRQESVGKIVSLITSTSQTKPASPRVLQRPISQLIFTWTRLPLAAWMNACRPGTPTTWPDHASRHAPAIYSLITPQGFALKSAHSNLITMATTECATSLARIQSHSYTPKMKPESVILHVQMEVMPIATTCVALRYARKFSMALWGLLQYV